MRTICTQGCPTTALPHARANIRKVTDVPWSSGPHHRPQAYPCGAHHSCRRAHCRLYPVHMMRHTECVVLSSVGSHCVLGCCLTELCDVGLCDCVSTQAHEMWEARAPICMIVTAERRDVTAEPISVVGEKASAAVTSARRRNARIMVRGRCYCLECHFVILDESLINKMQLLIS